MKDIFEWIVVGLGVTALIILATLGLLVVGIWVVVFLPVIIVVALLVSLFNGTPIVVKVNKENEE